MACDTKSEPLNHAFTLVGFDGMPFYHMDLEE